MGFDTVITPTDMRVELLPLLPGALQGQTR